MTGLGETHSGRWLVWQNTALKFRDRSYSLEKKSLDQFMGAKTCKVKVGYSLTSAAQTTTMTSAKLACYLMKKNFFLI